MDYLTAVDDASKLEALRFQDVDGTFLRPAAAGQPRVPPVIEMEALMRASDAVILHGPGVSVNVPSPDRFAIRKLIVSTRRLADVVGIAKSRKDLVKASELILALQGKMWTGVE